ncbi:unnamed protein product [Rotaria sp. Silwood2]|nr:unnamed protein product [Rotaria sp. Silwood2]CAF4336837.1 unnamed protein product [Rotaria sp. Silwood2]
MILYEKPIEEDKDDDPSEESNSGNSTCSDVVHPPMIAVKFYCVSKILEIMIERNCDSMNFIIGIIRINASIFNEPLNLDWFIDETQCFALNAMDKWSYAVFELEDGIFRSEFNQPEYFLHLTFRKLVKIYSIGIYASKENGPKIVKLFINQQQTIDLDFVKTTEPIKILEFDAEQLDCGTPILINDNQFDNVHSISVSILIY